MPHFFINSKDVKSNKITISDKENYTHIAKSLRSKVGERLLLIDENQIQYETVIEEITQKEITVNVENSYKSLRKLDFGLYLGQVPLRSDAQSIIMEKATELGADRVYPIISDNCALNKSVIEKKIPKWQRIMYEASKQCERAYIPICFETATLENIIKGDYKVIAFCERLAKETLHEYVIKNPIKKDDKILVIIGPEGGFSQREFDLFRENNIPMLTLGDLILKAETAVIVALGNLIYEYNINN
ncbi:16S rRNA (uracil(1498)-N(3))-methyltransferase [bacterium]|nr:16S rRNA (uracil(1498)-N(3))-methyltransferase [bacterium]